MSVVEELRKLVNLSKNSTDSVLANQIRKITDFDVDFLYQLILFFVKEKIDVGHSKEYPLAELQKRIPLKKTRLIEKLQKIVSLGLLSHTKRKYKILMDSDLISRIWNYYNETEFDDSEKTKVWNLLFKKIDLERKYEQKILLNNNPYFSTINRLMKERLKVKIKEAYPYKLTGEKII